MKRAEGLWPVRWSPPPLCLIRTNTAAAALYRKLGFRVAYGYWYRVPPGTQDARRA